MITLGMKKSSMIRLAIFLHCLILATCDTQNDRSSCSATTPPSSSTCGKAGSLKHPLSLGASQRYGEFGECLDLCSRHRKLYQSNLADNTGCFSFSYSSRSGICTLYQRSVSRQGFVVNTQSDTKYWDLNCFDCPEICPQTIDTNLIDNGDFEMPLLGPWRSPGFGQKGSLRSPGLRSSKLFACEGKDCQISQSFDTCLYSFYVAGLHFKIEGPNPDAQKIEIGLSGTDGIFRGSRDWKFVELWFEAPFRSSDELSINFYSSQEHTYFLDTATVHRISGKFSTVSGAVEQISNGGFESGKLDPWNVYQSQKSRLKVIDKGIDSSHGLHYVGRNGIFALPSLLRQRLKVTIGVPYLLRFTMKKLTEDVKFGSVKIGGTFIEIPRSQIQNDTLRFELPFRPEIEDPVLEFSFTSRGELLIDNISVKRRA